MIPANPSQEWDLFRQAWNWKDLAHRILERVESRWVPKSDGMRYRIAWLTIRFMCICHLDSYIPWNKRYQPKTQPKHWVNLDLAQWYSGGACGKELTCQCRPGFDPWREDPLEEGMATYSRILAWRIPTDRGTWLAAVHSVTKSRTQLKWHSSSSSNKMKAFFFFPALTNGLFPRLHM